MFLLLLIFYIVFAHYFKKQEEQTSKVIYQTILGDIKGKAYTISKSIEKKEDVLVFRALMGNIVANSNFINTILIFDGDELLLTTDPKVKKIGKDIILDDLETFNEKLKNIINSTFAHKI